MDRKQLRTVFQGINAGDSLTVNFGDSRQTETFKVINKRVWKGKGGSLLAECVNLATEKKTNIGTFSADEIVNIKVNDGETVGLVTGTSLPKLYSKDANKSLSLKTQLLDLLATGKSYTVEVESSTAPEFAGRFAVQSIRRTPGRNGPVVMSLTSLDSENTVLISSTRHAGVIDRIIVSAVEPVSSDV